MKKMKMNLTCENSYFVTRQEGPVILFSLKGNFLLSSTLLEAKEAMLEYFDSVSTQPDVRVVVLLSRPRKARRDEFLTFFDMVRSCRLSKNSVLRLYVAIDQFMLYILSSDLIFVDANCGEILPLFASIGMACDHRIVGDNAVFQNPALDIGLVPKGGGAWFLTRCLGRERAFEILLSDRDIHAQDALKLGLIEQCVPAQDVEKEALAAARRFAALPATSLRLAKRLVNRSMQGLSEYLEFENSELLKAMHEMQLLK
ncbi:MAG: enoyl-CoA hydratase/isomerase family protein [Desulfobacteraceae bacterium]|jgi:enoyl-CoA hydratase/carnithine racemase